MMTCHSKKNSIAELLATNDTKTQIAAYLADGLLKEYTGNTDFRLVVAYGGKICINMPHTLDIGFRSHSHEEADTQILLHVLRNLSESTYKHFDIYSH